MKHEAEPNETTDSVVVECDLAEPPAKVWKALTEPALLAAWLMPNDIRPEVGARFTLQADADAGNEVIACEVLAAEPPRLLSYRWRSDDADDRVLDSTVTFVLTDAADGGTHLRVVHDRFAISIARPTTCVASSASQVTDLAGERARRRARLPRAGSANAPTEGGLRWVA